MNFCWLGVIANSAESGPCQIKNASMKKMEYNLFIYSFNLKLNLFYDLGNDVAISIDKDEF